MARDKGHADFLFKKVSHLVIARWHRWRSLAQSWQRYCHWTHTHAHTHTHSCSFVLIVAHSEASSKLASGDLTKISKIVVGWCAKWTSILACYFVSRVFQGTTSNNEWSTNRKHISHVPRLSLLSLFSLYDESVKAGNKANKIQGS